MLLDPSVVIASVQEIRVGDDTADEGALEPAAVEGGEESKSEGDAEGGSDDK